MVAAIDSEWRPGRRGELPGVVTDDVTLAVPPRRRATSRGYNLQQIASTWPGADDAYDRGVAHASPSPTPNPDAMKFTLDTTLPVMLNVTGADAASGDRFAEAVFAAGGVAAIFGVDDFITVTRQPGFEWDPIVAAVVAAAARDL